jgi:hypothetical protein
VRIINTGSMALDDLDLADLLAVQRLRYLRQRSMGNPAWRDADYLGLYLRRRYLRWSDDSPLEALRLQAQRAINTYRNAVKRGGDADAAWECVRVAVDAIIEKAEDIIGHRIKPRAI